MNQIFLKLSQPFILPQISNMSSLFLFCVLGIRMFLGRFVCFHFLFFSHHNFVHDLRPDVKVYLFLYVCMFLKLFDPGQN